MADKLFENVEEICNHWEARYSLKQDEYSKGKLEQSKSTANIAKDFLNFKKELGGK